jgi:hypothetical protein
VNARRAGRGKTLFSLLLITNEPSVGLVFARCVGWQIDPAGGRRSSRDEFGAEETGERSYGHGSNLAPV